MTFARLVGLLTQYNNIYSVFAHIAGLLMLDILHYERSNTKVKTMHTNLIVVAIHFSRSASSKIMAAFLPPSYKLN